MTGVRLDAAPATVCAARPESARTRNCRVHLVRIRRKHGRCAVAPDERCYSCVAFRRCAKIHSDAAQSVESTSAPIHTVKTSSNE